MRALTEEIAKFVRERDWEQFHDPKNLAMAVASEAGELAAELRWVPSEQSDAYCAEPEARARIEAELADVAITLVMLAERTGIDLEDAMRKKLARNREKYPAQKWRGRYR